MQTHKLGNVSNVIRLAEVVLKKKNVLNAKMTCFILISTENANAKKNSLIILHPNLFAV